MTTVQLTLIIANMYIAASLAGEGTRHTAIGLGMLWLVITAVAVLLGFIEQ